MSLYCPGMAQQKSGRPTRIVYITQGLTLDMNTRVEFVTTGCSTTLFVCLQRIWKRTTHILEDSSHTESKAGRNPQVTVNLRRHLVREPPAARMKWKRICRGRQIVPP